jgi:mRNA interferase RelE/StbE
VSGRYTVEVRPSARKQLNDIEGQDRARVLRRIAELADNPRPHGTVKLTGSDEWRIRIGNYRVVYTIADDVLVVTVVEIGHRREIYRSR